MSETSAAVVPLRSPRPQQASAPFRSPAWWFASSASLAPVAVALICWFVPLQHIELRRMSSIGLLSVLPVPSLLALALLCSSFAIQLRRAHARPLILLLHIAALVVMIYGLPLIEPEPRFAVTWRHVGIVQTIQNTGSVDPRIDAYFSWPGFFAAAALVAGAAGVHNVLSITPWAPLGFELLALPALLLITRALTTSARLRWLAVWCFYLANWVGQDYFSPQAFTYVLYLIVLAVLLTWMRASGSWRPPWALRRSVRILSFAAREGQREVRVPGRVAADKREAAYPVSPRVQAALVGIVILVIAAIVPSHQLTPFALLPGIALLVLLRRCSARGLPVVIALMIATWLSYKAVYYLAGHGGKLLNNVGSLGSTLHESVGSRVQGASGHVLVTTAQLALAGSLWTLAALGAWRRARRGYDDTPALVLGLASLVLPVLQPYGGEILLRIFLFSLPFTTYLAAGLLLTPSTLGRSPLIAIAVGVLSVALATGNLLVRYGNEQMDWFSRGEVTAVTRMYDAAPPGSTLISWSTSLPWQQRQYAEHHYRSITNNPNWARVADLPAGSAAQVAAIAGLMRDQRHGAFLILTRSQAAQVDLTGLSRPGTVERVRAALTASPAFNVVYANRDGAVFTAKPAPHRRRSLASRHTARRIR